MLSGGAQLALAIGDAYTKIAGGGAQADTIATLTARAYNFFKSKGGNIDAAKVSVDDAAKKFKISDTAHPFPERVDRVECAFLHGLHVLHG